MKPGLYPDMDEATYHGHHESLSCSGAKKLLPPSCPAKFKAAQEGPAEIKEEFDFGHVAHRLILGKGSEVEVLPFDSWRTNAVKDAEKAARAEGKTPILEATYQRAETLAAAVKEHPIAGALFTDGRAEVSAFWEDGPVLRRARFDYLRDTVEGRRLLLPDLKTALSAEPEKFGKSAADFGYSMQDQWYTDAARAVDLDDDPAFLFVVVEKTPPYVVTVGELDDDAKQIGRYLNRKALGIYAACVASDHWPPYSEEVVSLSLPGWFTNKHEEAFSR